MKNTVQITDKNIFQTYSRYPVVLVKGKGSKLWDARATSILIFSPALPCAISDTATRRWYALPRHS